MNILPNNPAGIPNSINPFGKFCITIGAIPATYKTALTYEEQLYWFSDFLENTVIPALNNNAEVVEELQNLFVELKTYVDNYFKNLDVQEEINNKLDEMAESGVLQEIIDEYLKLKTAIIFNNVNEMQNSTNLIVGSYARTLGFYEKNDGGNAFYYIREVTNQDVINDADLIPINNTNLIAELIPENEKINIEVFGAKGDGLQDDLLPLTYATNYCAKYDKILSSSGKTYLISDNITIENCQISFNWGKIKSNQKIITLLADSHLWDYEGDRIIIDEKIKFEDTNVIVNSPAIVVQFFEFIDWHESAITLDQVRTVDNIFYDNNRSDVNTVSLTINATDKIISRLHGRGGFTGIVVNAQNTTICQSQLWLGANNKVNDTLDGSKFIHVTKGTGLKFDEVVSDTYQYALYFEQNGIRATLNGFEVINNNRIYANSTLYFINKFEPLIGNALIRLTNFARDNVQFTINSPCLLDLRYFDGTPTDANQLTNGDLIKSLFQSFETGDSVADNITLNNTPLIRINKGRLEINIDATINEPFSNRIYIDTTNFAGNNNVNGYAFINLQNQSGGEAVYGPGTITKASNGKILISSLVSGYIKRIALSFFFSLS